MYVSACHPDIDTMKLLPLRNLRPLDLSRARDIYDESFPAWEREDFEQVLERGTDEGVQQYVCVVEDQIVGLATLSPLRSVGWHFLEYFALARDSRSQGLGSRFWSCIAARLDSPVVIEVEHPTQPGITADEILIRLSRIRFWQRAGFTEIPAINYRVPRFDGRNEHFEPLLLMSTMPPLPPLCSSENLISALYAEGYCLADAQQRAVASQNPLYE